MSHASRLFYGARLIAIAGLLGLAPSCGDDETTTPPPPDEELPGPSRGNALILSADDQILAAVNRDVGSVSIFSVTYRSTKNPELTLKKEVSLGKGSEPWQVVMNPKGTAAWVVLRKEQQVVRISDLRTTPREDGRIKVGSEPTGLAITPNGKQLWVTNWIDGTVTHIDPKTMTVQSTVDLNKALVGTGLLGRIQSRPGLAHPRSITAVGMGGEDIRVYVTEYYGQRTEPEKKDGSNADTSRQGIVYRIDTKTGAVKVIKLAPLGDMGFKDHNGNSGACFPNQLQSITVNKSTNANRTYGYITSICASPKGPIGVFTGPTPAACTSDAQCPGGVSGSCGATGKCSTNCTADAECGTNGGKCAANICAPNVADVKVTTAGLVSVIDLDTDEEITSSTFSLNAQLESLYVANATPDDGTRRYPGVPVDVAVVPGTGDVYVTSNAGDALFHFEFDPENDTKIVEVGSKEAPFVNLNPTGILPPEAAGKNPIGTSIGYTGQPFAFVANDASRNITVVDLAKQTIAGGLTAPVVTQSAKMPEKGSAEDRFLIGKRFFNTGTGRWSLKGQGWSACQSCHVEGYSDNVTWHFARGPRQSVSLDGTFSSKDPSDQRILNYTAIFDEITDFEGNTRGISGGVGAVVSAKSVPPAVTDRIDLVKAGHAGLNGSGEQAADLDNPAGLPLPSVLDDWQNITTWVQGIRSPRAPSNLNARAVAAGQKLFVEGNCAGCHGGDKWTISTRFYTPSIATMTDLAATWWDPPYGFPAALVSAPKEEDRFLRGSSTNPNLDQIQCILRPVGTFDVADDLAGISELRGDMKTVAQGNEATGKGYNPPSLLGLTIGAPYFHAGNASSLESLLSPTFKAHYAALSPYFLEASDPKRAEKVSQLVQYLLSIDEDTKTLAIPAPGKRGGDFCSTYYY